MKRPWVYMSSPSQSPLLSGSFHSMSPLWDTLTVFGVSIVHALLFPFDCWAVFHVWTCCNLVIHSPVSGHPGGSQLGTLSNKAAVNICVQVFVWAQLPVLPGKYMGEEWLNHMVGIYLIFKKDRQIIFQSRWIVCARQAPADICNTSPRPHWPHYLSESCLMTTLMSVSTDMKGECL